ncbi:DDE-type integrase/transposase/recombinase [Granulicella arctica]|uniref:DDE-type integrase/transposase/recombinase n=1 Tax=Granulicella arctica TaxID=940613 RepID=UPI003D7C2DD4
MEDPLAALGEWTYLYLVVDKAGQIVDFRLSRTRDVAAATAFFKKAIRHEGRPSQTITLDGYAASHRFLVPDVPALSPSETEVMPLNGDRPIPHTCPVGVWLSIPCSTSARVTTRSFSSMTGRSFGHTQRDRAENTTMCGCSPTAIFFGGCPR